MSGPLTGAHTGRPRAGGAGRAGGAARPVVRPEPVVQPEPVQRRGRLRGALATVAIDTAPLRDSRLPAALLGQGVSFAGSMITYVAVPYQAYG